MTFEFKPAKFPENAVHVAVDLETASTEPNAAIVQIALVVVNSIYDYFGAKVSLADCEREGFHVDKATMEFWDKQPAALRNEVFSGNATLRDVMGEVGDFFDYAADGYVDRLVLWGNGVDFDNVILKNSFERYYKWPIHYRNNHHLRTLRALVPEQVQREAHENFIVEHPLAVPHNAYYDALYQAYQIEGALEYHETCLSTS